MLDYEEIAVLDRNAQFLGVPTFALMEHAGAGVAKIAQEHRDITGKSVALFCGLGNNGGDGLVAARYLANSGRCNVRLVLLGQPDDIKSPLAAENFHRLPKNVEIITMEKAKDKIIKKIDLSNETVIIDAMLGVGITGVLQKPYSSAVALINSTSQGQKKGENVKKGKKPLIISVDIPTGLGTKTAVNPDLTVTFHDSKIGMSQHNSGKIIIHDIGIPKDAEKFLGPGELTFIPKFKAMSHKGDHGRLLIIGGGPYTGAPALVGLSALRTGVDLAHVATPHQIANVIASFSPNFIVHPLAQGSNFISEVDVDLILAILDEVELDAVVMGPGLGRSNETLKTVNILLEKLPKKLPIVLDADAFNAIAKLSKNNFIKLLGMHTGVLTPHKGEFNKILSVVKDPKKFSTLKSKKIKKKGAEHQKIDPEIDVLSETTKRFTLQLSPNWAVLLKGHIDIVTDGTTVKLNRLGNPGMTVGGTGDVLAGITGALLAMGIKPFKAARAAAFMNGYAGDLAWEKYNKGLTATDIIDLLPRVFIDFID